MSVSTMEKMTVIAPRDDTDAIVRRLMRMRSVSLTERDAAKEDALRLEAFSDASAVAEAQTRVSRVAEVLPTLTKRSKRKKSLFRPVTKVSFREFYANGRYEKTWKIVEETAKILKQREDLRAQGAAALGRMQSYTPYLAFGEPLDFAGTATTRQLLGCLPAGVGIGGAEAATAELGVTFEVLSEDTSGTYLSALCHKAEEEEVLRALASVGFLRANFKEAHGYATMLYDEAERERARAAQAAERCEDRLDALSENLTDVEILYDVEQTTLLAEENKRKLAATEQCAILSGWCPTAEKERVIAALDRFGAAYEFEPPAEDDDVPVLLHNNGYARNFEWVLGMYSYPKYGKFDPTFVMSIFYFIIFGLMFADAGYGLLLMIACFGAVRWFEPREGMKRFLLMFGYCGISCVICGVLFGSYFGNFPLAFMENVLKVPVNELPNLSLLPTTEANVALLFDPLQNPMAFLIVSLAVGGVHLIAGMAVKGVLLCKEGKPLDALFDIVTYWVLFAGIGLIFVSKVAGFIVCGVGALSIIATQGRAKKGIAGKLIGGFGGIYGLVGYASDLLSYSRILALGLAAGVIGQVVNILATMKGATFIGFVMMVVVFIVGHVLNLAINVLGTFVHTSRLQYIEFFGKFYEDGGTPFKPITPSDRYAEDVTPFEENAPLPENK